MRPEFELHQLIHFLAVAKAGNLSRAATELNLSQPALSRSIQKLELAVGLPLFERRPRGVRLTEAGTSLQIRANEIKRLVDGTISELQSKSIQGRIRLAVIPTIAPYFLPQVLKSFGKANPDIKVHVQEDTTQNILQKCRDGDIDIGLVALPIHEKRFSVEPLFEEELVLVMPRGHELERRKQLKLADLEDYPFISLDRQHCLSDNIAEFCSRKSVAPVIVERTNQIATIQELVALHHGVSILPAMAKELDKSNKRAYRSFSAEKPTRTIALLQNPNLSEHNFVDQFSDHMRRLAESL